MGNKIIVFYRRTNIYITCSMQAHYLLNPCPSWPRVNEHVCIDSLQVIWLQHLILSMHPCILISLYMSISAHVTRRCPDTYTPLIYKRKKKIIPFLIEWLRNTVTAQLRTSNSAASSLVPKKLAARVKVIAEDHCTSYIF